MSRLAPALLLLSCSIVCSCESTTYDDCVHSDDPTIGNRRDQCAVSRFLDKDMKGVAWRDVNGVVRRGENGVAGAIVAVTPTRGALAEKRSQAKGAVTTANGFFGPITDVGLQYDVTVRIDRDVVALRDLAFRYVQPSVELESASLLQSWLRPIDLQLTAPIPSTHTLAFFATGDTTFGVSGDVEHGVSIIDLQYGSTSTLHVIEYEKGKDLSTAVAYGKVDVTSNAGSPQLARVQLAPITTFQDATINVTPPPGFAVASSELVIVYSRTSGQHLTTVSAGVAKRLPVIPNVGYYGYRVRATAPNGAITESAETGFDIYKEKPTVELLDPPSLEAPLDGAAVALTDRLRVRGKGVFEHVLVPEGGGPTIRVLTTQSEAEFPDFNVVGAAPPSGRYTWTVRSYPKLQFVDQVDALLTRRYQPKSTSAPRTLVFP